MFACVVSLACSGFNVAEAVNYATEAYVRMFSVVCHSLIMLLLRGLDMQLDRDWSSSALVQVST